MSHKELSQKHNVLDWTFGVEHQWQEKIESGIFGVFDNLFSIENIVLINTANFNINHSTSHCSKHYLKAKFQKNTNGFVVLSSNTTSNRKIKTLLRNISWHCICWCWHNMTKHWQYVSDMLENVCNKSKYQCKWCASKHALEHAFCSPHSKISKIH